MIRPDAPSRTRLLLEAVRPPLVAGPAEREIAPLQPGQPVRARVEQETATGHLVSLSGRTYEFKLPEGIRQGDLLRLVYLGNTPRPTFALLGNPGTRADTMLSEAGRLLASLLDPASGPVTARPQNPAPLFPAGMPESKATAGVLRQALSLSGLFYESHQAQWILGGRATAQLRQEPQGRLAPLFPASEAQGEAPDGRPQRVPAGENAGPAPAGVREADSGNSAPKADLLQQRPPAHPETHTIIRQQLASLESGVVSWRGQVWPGQNMEWEVGDAPDQAEPAAARVWRTRLKLTLPQLGEIEASIELGAAGLRVRMLADSPEHATLLRASGQALAQQLAGNGLAVAGFEVQQHAGD